MTEETQSKKHPGMHPIPKLRMANFPNADTIVQQGLQEKSARPKL